MQAVKSNVDSLLQIQQEEKKEQKKEQEKTVKAQRKPEAVAIAQLPAFCYAHFEYILEEDTPPSTGNAPPVI